MADISIRHAFVSTKPDSLDSTIVSSSEWNANEIISGGATGQVMTRNGGSPTGGSYIDGAMVQRVSDSFAGSIATTPPMSVITVTFTSNGVVLLIPNVLVALSSGAAGILSIQRNGSNIATGAINCIGTWFTPFTAFAVEAPGTYTYNILITGTSGAVTTAQTVLNVLKLGSV